MLNFDNQSIQTKLTVAMLLTSGLALAIAGIAFVVHDMQSYRRFTTENLYTLARLIAENSTAALSFVDAQAARDTLDGLRAEPQIVYAAIFRRDGRLFTEYRSSGSSGSQAEPPAASQLSSSPWSTFVIPAGNEGDRGIDNAIEVYKKISLLGDELGVVIVRANLTELDARWRWELAILLSVLLAAGSAANFLAARFQRKISEPILALEGAMRDFSENHNYNAFVEKHSDDEIGRLITGFNKMLDQILLRDKRLEGVISELNIAKESAELANSTKSRFIATLSHEIRNPMTGVLGMSELLVREQLDSRSHSYARSIHRATDNLLHLVNDILDYSKIESGRMTLESIEFSLVDAIDAVIDVFASQASAKGVDLIYLLPPNVPRRVGGDPVRLRQVLTNLIGNSVKFTDAGCVVLRVSRVERGEPVAASNRAQIQIEFAVTDTGIGIPEAAQKDLFEAFSQADMSTTRRYGGSGLGLAISKELVELMGGRLSVVSKEGHGSTFSFDVCFSSAVSVIEAPNSPAIVSGAWQSGRILLAEDNLINQEVAVNMLQHFGCAVDVVGDGVRAVEAACAKRYDLVLMDWQMPEMDGLTAAQRIRQSELAQAVMPVPIVLVTATALSEELLQTWAGTIDGYVAKPYSVAQLSGVLKRWSKAGNALMEDKTPSAAPLESVRVAYDPTARSAIWNVDDPILDASAFDNVRVVQRADRPDLVARLIELFLTHSKQLLSAIEAARRRQDAETLFREAHSLKNLSLNVGARDLVRLSEAMEHASAAKDWRQAASIEDDIAEKYAETCQALLAKIGAEDYATRSAG